MSESAYVIGPASPKQEMILNTSVDFAIVGGSMGSGKSYVALLFPLKYADDPYFRGIIFRKTTKELTAQGGLWETACEIYRKLYGDKLKIRLKDLKITFPSGASVQFSHLETKSDVLKHQGAQYTFVLFDEATHFTKYEIEYLSGRIRSAKAKHKKQLICTCNPDPDWFALPWIKPYLTVEGTPNPEMDGVVMYYAVENDVYVWARDRSELEKKYGTGDDSGIKSFTFISANCFDNPPLLKNDPTYVSNLKAKPWVDVQRYLYGNWFVRPSAAGFWKREWCEEVATYPEKKDIVKIIRAWDFAGTLVSPVTPDPDYSASTKMALLKSGDYIILDVVRFRARYGDLVQRILEIAYEDGKGTDIIIPQDSGAAGKAAAMMVVRELLSEGFYAKTKTTSKSKVDRFRPFAAASENGLVKILKGCCNDLENKIVGDNNFFYAELEAFTGGRAGHDDMCDSTADCWISLASKQKLPLFNPPSMTQTNPFKLN